MKLRIMSDLHLEVKDMIVPDLEGDKETVLILAGDIGIVHRAEGLDRYMAFLSRASLQFKWVILIMGNHEHYGGSFRKTAANIRGAIAARNLGNVVHLEKEAFVIDDVAFIGATMWTDCNNQNPLSVYMFSGMADNRVIRTGPNETLPYERKFGATDSWTDHMYATQFIFKTIDKHKEAGHKTIVITHHAPSAKSVAPQWKGDSMNMFFHSDLDLDIMDHNPDLWIHGHMHTKSDYLIDDTLQICNTRVICNPRGYVSHEFTDFNEALIVETDEI